MTNDELIRKLELAAAQLKHTDRQVYKILTAAAEVIRKQGVDIDKYDKWADALEGIKELTRD